jgi:hypothetical protein
VIGCTVIANANSAMRKCGPFWRSRDVTLYYGSAHDERTSFAEIIRRLFDGQRVRFGGRRLRRLVVFISVVFRSIAAEMYGANPQRAVRHARRRRMGRRRSADSLHQTSVPDWISPEVGSLVGRLLMLFEPRTRRDTASNDPVPLDLAAGRKKR